jgi:hypothetical protein
MAAHRHGSGEHVSVRAAFALEPLIEGAAPLRWTGIPPAPGARGGTKEEQAMLVKTKVQAGASGMIVVDG